jgi:NAD(P) transhydrogenase subunit beta
MPQLIAAFHSLVGLAAVFVAVAGFYAPESFNIGTLNNIKTLSLVEMSLGAVIGAITFSGSVIAFGKLQGIMSGAPIVFKGQHLLNLIIGIIILGGIVYLCLNQSANVFWIVIILAFLIAFIYHNGI